MAAHRKHQHTTLPEREFIEVFEAHGAQGVHELTGADLTNIYRRRRLLENKLKRTITPPAPKAHLPQAEQYPHRIEMRIKDGVVLIGSDAHYWPGPATTAHRAFVRTIKELKPVCVVMNGDALDGSTISRHPPIGWEKRPSLVAEIEAVQDRLEEIEAAVDRRKARPPVDDEILPRYKPLRNKQQTPRLIWPLGNHDMRYGTRLATVAPEYAKVHGTRLKDHFSTWEPCWSLFINDDVVVKHRYKGGIHATHNNTMWAGRTMVTGHLHALKVTPLDDYNGTRFGVDTGTLADPRGQQFTDYTEDGPLNWRSGFAVLTFKNWQLLWPELVHVMDEAKGLVQFRGEVFRV